jgi:hypothetical protein
MPARRRCDPIWKPVHAIVQHPLAAIGVGLLVVVAAVEQVLAQAGQAGSWLAPGAHVGLLVLGVYQVMLALGFLLTGARFMGFGVLAVEEGRHTPAVVAVCRFVHNPVVALVVGAAIITSGVVGLLQSVAAQAGSGLSLQAGVIAMGLYASASNLGNALVGLEVIDTVETEQTWHGRLFHRIEHVARRPWVELALAVLIIGLGVWQSLIVDPAQPRSGAWMLILLAGYQLLRTLPMVFMGAILADDGLAPAASPIADEPGS